MAILVCLTCPLLVNQGLIFMLPMVMVVSVGALPDTLSVILSDTIILIYRMSLIPNMATNINFSCLRIVS